MRASVDLGGVLAGSWVRFGRSWRRLGIVLESLGSVLVGLGRVLGVLVTSGEGLGDFLEGSGVPNHTDLGVLFGESFSMIFAFFERSF